jgi:hypothetical protein
VEILERATGVETDEVILSHLTGEKIIGVYPLLKDDTCWFVVSDFDGQGGHSMLWHF